MLLIPLETFLECNSRSTKDIQRTTNRKVNTAVAQMLDMVQILQISSPSSIGDRNTTPLRQLLNELLVDAFLETLIVRCVDQKFGTIRLERFDGRW